MKTNKLSILIFILLIGIAACKKDNKTTQGTAALNVINASADVPNLALNFSPTTIPYYKDQVSVSFGSAMEFGLPVGNNQLTLVSSADTVNAVFRGNLNLKVGGIYSLYVIGQLPKIDTLLLQERLPKYQDSAGGARFINLSPDTQPISINLQGSSQIEFSNLSYKQVSVFKLYPATMDVYNNGGYNFEVRDASNNVLTTFNWVPTVFRNNTLVFSGTSGGGTLTVFQVKNY